ncbi:MAG: ABC transporter permease [Sedimentisphaerales bacterium]|nr:ABC transporter permease [Sedimentisphaerales bacterium]
MRTIWHDMRYGLRQLRRSPGFTAIAVLSLALGIGANTAIFSLINGILYKSLPVRNPGELRLINWTGQAWPGFGGSRDFSGNVGRTRSHKIYSGSFPYPAYRDFVGQAKGFSDMFAFSYFDDPVTISVRGVASLANGQMVSGNFFKSYGAGVLIGRSITSEDDRPDATPVAVLTYPFWRRVYGLDPHVLGQTLTVDKTSFTVIGVLPRHYVGPLSGERRTDFYVPMMAPTPLCEDEWLSSYDAWWVQIMGRLAPETDEAQVQSSLEIVFSHILNRSTVEIDRPGILLQKGRQGVLINRQVMAQPLWYLLGVVGLVLLIACTNLAGLLLARGAARQHEMAVRAAMGAGRWRLIHQSLTESMILSMAGVCLGLVFSVWIRAALTGFVTDSSRYQQFDQSVNAHIDLSVDTNVLLFALAVGMVTTLLSGLFPALRAGSTNPSAGLKDSGSRGAPRLGLGKVLVSAQVGLSVILVMVGGLLCQTLINLYRTDPGFDAENLLLIPIEPLSSLSPPEDLNAFYGTVRQRIAEIPGVRSVALSCRTILEGQWWNREISIPGRSDKEPQDSLALVVSEGYFTTMRMKFLQGRDFRVTDTEDSQTVAIVNEKFAREFFPDENPLGQFIRADGLQCQIVGLCSNQKYDSLRRDSSPILYLPYTQIRFIFLTCIVRSVLPPMSLEPAVRQAIADIDRNLPLEGFTTQELALKDSLARESLFAMLCGSLALLALALSCIGLYGLMAYNVARRTGEMGIRKALGAQPFDVAWPILREALILAAIGMVIGLPVALALVRVIRSCFYGIEPHDPLTIIGAATLMITVAALAAWIPARRAAKIDPMEALRYE